MRDEVAAALGIDLGHEVVAAATWRSCFEVSALAATSIGAAADALAALCGASHVTVDQRLASLWFAWSIVPDGWRIPGPWDAVAGDYPTRDGWIKLHTNAPHHREAALGVLGVDAERDAVAAAVAATDGEALEGEIVAAGGCAAKLRTPGEWQAHEQGRSVAAEPLIAWDVTSCNAESIPGPALTGVRVLDCTRVLAGPVASRFLAAFGADVLRIDPPHWDEPGVVPEVTVGKRCAGLDLTTAEDRERFRELLATADVFLHGYRSDALEGLGFGADQRRSLNSTLIDVSLDAYGFTGPWATRRGFDSLVQMSTGIAHRGMDLAGRNEPTPLPVQALDHGTGYLLAAAVLRGLQRRAGGEGVRARLSLARTAKLLMDTSAASTFNGEALKLGRADVDPAIEETSWGPARRLRFPARLEGLEPCFRTAATALRSADPVWLSA